MASDLDKFVGELVAKFGTVAVISEGAPCACGPGFCCVEDAKGGYGWCRERQEGEELPDCPHCGAAHQGTSKGRPVCWNCCEHPEPPYRTKPKQAEVTDGE